LSLALDAAGHSSDEVRPSVLRPAGNPEEAGPEFEAACPGWSKAKLAKDYRVGAVPSQALFKQCKFERLKVVSATEFEAVEVHVGTTALVLYNALAKGGVDAAVARELVRVVFVPLEGGTPPKEQKPSAEDRERDRARVKKLLEGSLK
jgi:hypothetical protein